MTDKDISAALGAAVAVTPAPMVSASTMAMVGNTGFIRMGFAEVVDGVYHGRVAFVMHRNDLLEMAESIIAVLKPQ